MGGLPRPGRSLDKPLHKRLDKDRSERRQGGPMIRAGRSEDGQPMLPDPAKPDPGRAGEPSSATLTATVAETQSVAEPHTVAETELDPATGPAAGGGARGALGRAVSHTWVRHLILTPGYEGPGIAASWPRFTYLADGPFLGLSTMPLWKKWYHVNMALGTIFLPMTIEAAVRFRRHPRMASAIALGVALGASILINQESTIVALVIAALTLVPWLVAAAVRNRALLRQAIKPLAVGALVGLVVAGPELIAMLQQIIGGGGNPPVCQRTAKI